MYWTSRLKERLCAHSLLKSPVLNGSSCWQHACNSNWFEDTYQHRPCRLQVCCGLLQRPLVPPLSPGLTIPSFNYSSVPSFLPSQFTPLLGEFFTSQAAALKVAVIFASGDRDEKSFKDYFARYVCSVRYSSADFSFSEKSGMGLGHSIRRLPPRFVHAGLTVGIFENYVSRKPSHEADRRIPSTLSRRSLCSAPMVSSSPTKGFSSCRSATSPSSPQLSPSH